MMAQKNIAGDEENLRLFSLEGLLPPGQALSVNTSYLIVSLISTTLVNGNPILLESRVTETDMRLLLTLLASPYYCSQEALLASLFCSYQGLIAGLFSPDSTAKEEWQNTVAEQHLLLQRTQEGGAWKKELGPLSKTLSKLRSKLHPFGLEIAFSSSYSAYRLIALHFLQ
jgi:hypothetical protein